MSMRVSITNVFLVLASPSLACDCGTSPLSERVLLSNYVFRGEVVGYAPLQSAELRVLERFKGETPGQLVVVAGRSDCDYFPEPTRARSGDQFLIFTTKTALGSAVSRCLGSAPVESASSELELLRKGLTK